MENVVYLFFQLLCLVHNTIKYDAIQYTKKELTLFNIKYNKSTSR